MSSGGDRQPAIDDGGVRPMHGELNDRIVRVRPKLHLIRQAFDWELERLGFGPDEVQIAPPDLAVCHLQRDPASGENALVGEWRDHGGHKCGCLVFHADGSYFVEYDIVKGHPTRENCWVEALTAWGRGGDMRVEPRLLDVLT